MENRKSKQANQEDKKLLYLQIGLTLAAALALVAFEWTTSVTPDPLVLNHDPGKAFIEEIIPPAPKLEVKPPPPPDPVIEKIIIHENEVIIDEPDFSGIDVDIDTEIPYYLVEPDEVPEDDPLVLFPETWPTFNGGDINQFNVYVANHLVYPQRAADNGVTGRVHLQFVVNKTGEVTDVVVVRGVNPDIDAEAIRVVKASPRWIPGKQGGIPVKVQYSFSILFMLQ